MISILKVTLRTVAVLLCSILLASCDKTVDPPPPPPPPSGDWNIYTIDSSGDTGENTSIAIDSNDKVHISYRDDSYNTLKYATNVSGSWSTYTVDNSVIVGDNITSIAVDSDNKAHIAYHENTNVDLRYATNVSGAWNIISVDTAGWVGNDPAIAVDLQGKVHISYTRYGLGAGGLRYATNSSGDWELYTVDDGGSGTSIAVGSDNNVHISYAQYNYPYEFLKCVTGAPGSWTIIRLDTLEEESPFDWVSFLDTDVALSSNEKIHLCYYSKIELQSGSEEGFLRYVTNESGAWEYTTIDTGGMVGQWCSLAMDSNDKIHICYLDRVNNDLKYATNSSGSWEVATIDEQGGWFCSIDIDSNDKVHISYHAGNNLKYATNK